jgi:flagellar hook-length control protein FliK
MPDDTSVPAAEGISFAAVLQAVLPAPPTEPSREVGRHETTGNGLPPLPGASVEPPTEPTVRESDLELEEFAVGMGINRDLARLLLSETASVAADGTKAPIDLSDVDVVVSEPDTDRRGVTEEESAVPMAMIAVVPPSPMAPPPIADEDLLMWRATVSRSETPRMAGMARPSESPTTPAAPMIPATGMTPATPNLVPTPADPMTDRSSMSQLRLRTWAPDERDILRTEVSAAVPAILTERPRPDRLAPLSGVATEAELTAAGYVSEASSVEKLVPEPKVERDLASSWKEVDPYVVRDETAPRLTTSFPMTTVSESSVGTDRGLAAMITLPSVSASPFEASLARPSATLPQTAEAVRVLVMPDPKLSADERVQAFAEAVGQRVLAQIRDDDWNVRLQLEPANMGTVDIDLTLRGTAVAANVSVANGEVRALMESGLPRLRDSLETAGLQLAGWTFGQSGSRPFNGSAQGWTAQAVRRHQAATGDDSAALAPLHSIAAKDPSSRAIDLFV